MGLEDHVVKTVRELANSTHSNAKGRPDISALVAVTKDLPLSKLSYWESLIRSEYSPALGSSRWRRWTNSSKQFGLTWIDVTSWDGYRREEALRAIDGGAPNKFFLSLAVRRLNDWVPQVRTAAREQLPSIIRASEAIDVIESLCVTLPYWNSWGRIEEQDRQVLLDALTDKAVVEAFMLKILTATAGPITSILAQASRTAVLDKHLKEISHNAVQPSVRGRAYRNQFEGKATWIEGREWEWTDIRYCEGRSKPILSERLLTVSSPFMEVMRMASVDRSSIVRRVAAEMLIRDLEKIGDEAPRLAAHFAADESHSVAERGKFALSRLANG